MAAVPQISGTEWQVMKVLWAKSPLTANEVILELAGFTSWKPNTVKTLLGRLVRKKALAFDKDGRTYAYYPLVAEAECVKAESRSFLDKVFAGSLSGMVARFLEEETLTSEELAELKELLERKER